MRLWEMITGRRSKWKTALDNGALVIDVRSAGEFSSGHVKGSRNIPLDRIGSSANELQKRQPVVVCCASGTRSAMARQVLRSKGVDAFNGGSWRSVNSYIKTIKK